MPGALDIVINLHTPEVLAIRPAWYKDKEFIGGKIAADEEIVNGLPIEKYIERRIEQEFKWPSLLRLNPEV